MEFPEAGDMLEHIFREDRRDRLFQIWLHDGSGLTFGEYLEKTEPKPAEKIVPSEKILDAVDQLFEGR